jgi:hypothetical protein
MFRPTFHFDQVIYAVAAQARVIIHNTKISGVECVMFHNMRSISSSLKEM